MFSIILQGMGIKRRLTMDKYYELRCPKCNPDGFEGNRKVKRRERTGMGDIQRTTLTAAEAAEYIGISYWMILEMAKKNQVPHIKVGSKYLFRVSALELWMKKQEETAFQEEAEGAKGHTMHSIYNKKMMIL